MPRIGIVTQSYYPARGGVSEHVHHQGLELLRRGHEVTLITGGDSNDSRPERAEVEEWKRQGGQLVRVGRTRQVSFNGATVSLVLEPGLAQGLYSLERDAFDVLHVHSPFEPLLPVAALHYFLAPAVATFHSAGAGAWLYRLFKPVLSTLASRLRVRVAVSAAARDHVAAVFPGNYEIIPNGVDTDLFAGSSPGAKSRRDLDSVEPWSGPSSVLASDSASNAARRPRILLVGRLDTRKGHECVLRALAAKPGLDVDLRIVGGGPLRTMLEELGASCGNRVTFCGPLDREELLREYEQADVFLAPATHGESFGVVLLEAMAAGLPILASSTEAYRAVLGNSDAAVWAEPGDTAAWGNALEHLLDRREAWPVLGRAGRRHVERFDWAYVVDALEEVYERILSGGAVRAPRIKRPRYSRTEEEPAGRPSLAWPAPSRSVREPAARK